MEPIPYTEFVELLEGLATDPSAAKLAEQAVGRPLGPSESRLVGQAATFARARGWPESSATDLACGVAALEGEEPDIGRTALILLGDDSAEVRAASPLVGDPLSLMATVVCSPSAFTGEATPAASSVALLESMSRRAARGRPWNFEWYAHEAHRLNMDGGPPTDGDVARCAFASRVDTVWVRLAAECIYELFRDKQAVISPKTLWVEPAGKIDNWMYRFWEDNVAHLPWFGKEYFDKPFYRGVGGFANRLTTNGPWTVSIFDGHDLLEADSEPEILIDWFACFSIAFLGIPSYDNINGQWRIPFMPAREGVGVLVVSAELSEHPSALMRDLTLPGVSWIMANPPRPIVQDEDGRPCVPLDDGRIVSIMELSDREALDSCIFYSYDEDGSRTLYWQVSPDNWSDSRES